jgi:hypothetical protein
MAQVITAYDLIRRSLYLINGIAAGEQMDSQTANDCLLTLNEMIDSWSTETLSVYRDSPLDVVLTPGKFSYTIGATGDIVADRPIWFNGAVCTWQGVTTPIEMIDQATYDSIPIKATSQPLVERLLYINDFPNGIINVFPIPSEAVTLTLSTAKILSVPATLSTSIALPPGYLRALRYCLAVDMWPEFNNPSTDIGTVKAIATKAKANIKIANSDDNLVSYCDVPNVDAGRSWDWRGA